MKKTTKEEKKKGLLHYFDWEMYVIIIMSYLFGFGAGYVHGWILLISLLFLAYPFYLKYKMTESK